MTCLITTKKIKELANKLPEETIESVKTIISLWQEDNKRELEDLPSVEEFRVYRDELRKPIGVLYQKNSKQDISSTNILKITPNRSNDSKAKSKGAISNKFIGYGIEGSSTFEYAKQAGKRANTGDYNSNDTIFVSILGRRGEESIRREHQNKTIEEAIKAIKAGATLITDNAEYLKHSSYNEGEKMLAKALTELGATYSERIEGGDTLGQWKLENIGNNDVEEFDDAFSNNSTETSEFESHFETIPSNDYPSRTKANIDWADVVLHMATNFLTAGEKLTKNHAGNKRIEIDMNGTTVGNIVNTIIENIEKQGLPTKNIKLNIAGNGIYSFPENITQENIDNFVGNIIQKLLISGITISEIRSGGQTGIDEAGIKAAQKLNIPWKVVATSDYAFREKDNNDIRGDRKAFMERFGDVSKISNKSPQYNAIANTVGKESVDMTVKTMEKPDSGLTKNESKSIKEATESSPFKVLVASEHTDPVFHAKKIKAMVEAELAKPPKERKFHMMYLITKHDGLPLAELASLKIPKFIHFSITSLGGTVFEPGVMKMDDMLDRIEEFVKNGLLKPRMVTIRIDPLIPGVTKKEDVRHIIERAKAMGINNFKFSVMDSYGSSENIDKDRYIIQRMREAGYEFEKYYDTYNNKVSFNAKKEVISEWYHYMDELGEEFNLMFNTCGEQPSFITGLKRINTNVGCLNVNIINQVMGTKDAAAEKGTQRPECSCFGNKIDALKYEDKCASSCLYCYARHGSDSAMEYYNEDGTLKDNAFTKTIDSNAPNGKLPNTQSILRTITYTPKGETTQTYTIKGTQIFNKNGNEVFKEDSKDRRKIFANLAVQEKRAVVVEYKDKQYVVNNKKQIISVTTGDMMKWDENNEDKKAIIKLAEDKFLPTNNAQIKKSFDIPLPSPKEPDKNTPKSYSAPDVVTSDERAKVDLNFDPITRRRRVNLIGQLFSDEVTLALIEIQENLIRRIEETIDNNEREQLQDELKNLDRIEVIKRLTPAGVFIRVLQIFKDINDASEQERYEMALDNINATPGNSRYSKKQKEEMAKKRADYEFREFEKVIENFNALAEETITQLVLTEGIVIDINSTTISEENLTEVTENGEIIPKDIITQEETVKESWMTEFRTMSSHESLSKEVRKVIAQIAHGVDDLGFSKFLDAEYVHAVLMDKLKDMLEPTDLLPMLDELSKTKPWVTNIKKKLENNEVLFSKFYQDFRKDFTYYWIQKKILNNNGTYTYKTIAVNKPEGIYYLFESWRDNYESGEQLDKDSVYKINSDINVENAEKGLKIVEELNNKFSNLKTEERLGLLNDKKVWNNIVKVLHMVGINVESSQWKRILTTIKSTDDIKVDDPIMILLPQLNVIFKGIKDGDIKTTISEDGIETKGDLINTFGTAYSIIASMVAEVSEDAIEQSITQTIGGKSKTFYGHTPPNYLGKLVKQLKNVRGGKKKYLEFLKKEYKQYDWFYKNEEWRNKLLEDLEKSESMRKNFDHKVLLSFDNTAYEDWDSLDYTVALLNEFLADPEIKDGNMWGWYYVPIQSDAHSADFIKLKRYVDTTEFDDNGKKVNVSYDKIILEQLIDIVKQEYDRINLVIDRDKKYKKDPSSIALIDNYDITRNKEGEVKSNGGSEFKFFPRLNQIRYNENGKILDREEYKKVKPGEKSPYKTFLQRINEASINKEDIKPIIAKALNFIMEREFEEEYKKWHDVGLLEENENGHCVHLPCYGQSEHNKKVSEALSEAKKILGNSWTDRMEKTLFYYNSNYPISDGAVKQVFEQIKEVLDQKIDQNTMSVSEVNDIMKNLTTYNPSKALLRNYFWNSKLATAHIIQLTTTDLAFYRDIEDFQKRFKEIHSPSMRLNTLATWKGQRVGKDEERSIYLIDNKIKSELIDKVKRVLDDRIAKGNMTEIDKDYILSKFNEVNVADAQAFRSLKSYREVMIMAGEWNDNLENAFDNFTHGIWNIEDFTTIWQTRKPFVYTQVKNESGIEGTSGIKTPVQHKNSEFLLMAAYSVVAGNLGKSDKLRAISEFMEKENIDVVQFESAVKAGGQGKIDLNGIEDYKEIKKVLMDYCFPGGSMNPNVVHIIPYSDYGTQTATPEHAIDAVQLLGTQIRKLITADISNDPDLRIEVDGKKYTKQEWLDLYNAINTENIIDKFSEIEERFKNPKEIEKLLLETMRSNGRYTPDMIKACTLDKNGRFNLPLFDPVQSQRIQNLINSIIKSHVTKQKTKGGAFIQVSDYGLTNQLSIVFKDSEGNLLNFDSYKKQQAKKKKKVTKEEYDKMVKKAMEEGKLSIAYFECYMPAYSKSFYEHLMKPGTHELDIDKLPEDLRRVIGYRIPTEDKYSMAPLFIKGFLPQQNGSAIMLPAEITTLSGSDFDIDKLYVMLPEFRISKYNVQKARRAYARENKSFEEFISKLGDSEMAHGLMEIDPEEFKSWFGRNKETFKKEKATIERINYNYKKKPQENSVQARNNALIDLMWGILTNEDTTSKILNPGGFDNIKKVSRIINILYNTDSSILSEELGVGIEDFLRVLMDMSLDDLNVLSKKVKNPLDPLAPMTQVNLHQRNMTGGKLVPIYANQNANHALIQHTEVELNPETGAFILNGNKWTSLHEITNKKGEIISKTVASFLAAAVDNGKDPVLSDLNQNTITADITMLLARLGYQPIEIGLFLAQPIIIEITKSFIKQKRKGKSLDNVIDEVITKYEKKSKVGKKEAKKDLEKMQFFIDDLAFNILMSKNLNDSDSINYYHQQMMVALLFQKMAKTANCLSELVQVTRADTSKGGAGPTIADTLIKIQKVKDFLKNSDSSIENNSKYPLKNIDIIEENLEYDSIDSLREKLLRGPLPYLQAFYTCGIEATSKMLEPYFPHYKKSFTRFIDLIRSNTTTGKLDVKTMNAAFNDLLVYIMTKTEFFGGSTIDGETVSSESKRNSFINDFPNYFEKVVSENPDIASNDLIKRLKTKNPTKTIAVKTIVFKNVGKLTNVLRDRYERAWASLLHSKNPAAVELAVNLFRYSFYRNGLAFGPSSFAHLAPLEVRLAIPEYKETLYNILSSDEDYLNAYWQFMYNHLDNKKLVHEIPSDSHTKFIDENNKIKDEIWFSIDDHSSASDKKVVKDVINTQYGKCYIFFDFISRKEGGKYVYYRLNNFTNADAQYIRIEPLGVSNNFVEYEYERNVIEMTSVIGATNDSVLEDPNDSYTDLNDDPEDTDETSKETSAQNPSSKVEDTASGNKEKNMANININKSYTDANEEQMC